MNYKLIISFIEKVRIYLFQEYFKTKIKFKKIKKLLKKITNNKYSSIKFNLFLNTLKQDLELDLETYLINDPASKSKEEVIFCYPGFFATFVYRISHEFYLNGFTLHARLMSEIAHALTGIDIHPASTIGKSFFIDHGTGIVIGETTIIKNNVKLYQGVTLGTKSFNNHQVKRHPTILDNVTIYADATILGGDTVIGENSIIGTGVIVTSPVKCDSKITNKFKNK